MQLRIVNAPIQPSIHLNCFGMHVQVARRVLQVNITATLGVDVAPGASDEEVEAALAAANLSADEPIGMLASNPDKFFGRTTKVSVEASVKYPHSNI